MYRSNFVIYTLGVRKTTLVVDEALLQRASAVLGTRGLKATVDRALEEVVAADGRRRFAERLREMRGLELDDAQVMDSAWR
jgi:Arc/MetJ family transcription regulator